MSPNEERKVLLHTVCETIVNRYVDFSIDLESEHTVCTSPAVDGVLAYATETLSLGLFYMEYKDGIREGDGNRVLRCWQYLLPLFSVTGRTNYSLEVLYLLYQFHFDLTPRQAQQAIWGRFVNTHGTPGRNVACDLHLEHLNRLCKDAVAGLGANKTETVITRVGKCIGPLSEFLTNFDAVNSLSEPSGRHSNPKSQKDRDKILEELMKRAKVFDNTPGRTHNSFKITTSILRKVEKEELELWIKNHVRCTTK